MASAAATRDRRRQRHGWAAIAVSAMALALLWRILPANSALYDGLCGPPGPYRSLGTSPPPLSASAIYSGTDFPSAELQTGEPVAQAQVLMMAGAFLAQSPVTISISPVPPPSRSPEGKVQDGDAYKVSATAAGRELQPNPQGSVTIILLGTGSSGPLTIYADTGTGWRPLRTFNLGCGTTFEAVSPRLGYFALFRTAGSTGSSGGFPVGAVVGILGAVVVATLGLARLASGRRRGG